MAALPPSSLNSPRTTEVQQYDVIIIGAGFSGISALHRFRNQKLHAHVFEAGSDFGGAWHWNRYPGARVDSETPFYQLSIPSVYNTWNFSSRFPDHHELRRYMAHIDATLGLRRDTTFNARVCSCTWDNGAAKWAIRTESGVTAAARWLVLATGLLHKPLFPSWPGKDKYKGVLLHSAQWDEGISVKEKKVAVIGAGATSVQIVQELGKEAKELTLLVRRPSYCIPMCQCIWSEEEKMAFRASCPELFAAGRNSAVGIPNVRNDMRAQDVSAEKRERYLEEIWAAGGMQFLLRNYKNIMLDKEANHMVYEFWKKKVRQRLTDDKKQALMTPDEMPFYFSTKRTPLEHDYYDVLNQDNVDIVDLNKHGIRGFTERGLQLGDQDREFDYIVCATGFDSISGSVTSMGLKSKDGVDIKDIWKDGIRTYLGMMVHGFPNAFMVYAPQAPNALVNGPTIIECQCDFVCDTIMSLGKNRIIEPTREAEDGWKEGIDAAVSRTLYPHTNSWWNTSNVPGKKAEKQLYILGISNYEKQCRETVADWKGFVIREVEPPPYKTVL
ncbi:Cyclopentanone 12-monooxygenase [Pyrenophora seminiperda CCB06]|uniref:Cyclopentanone 12-monooxygenase n=1 Tax=Pyrenophora seminiperda CCB06 TaxID=1302712 RepID=A0A3M7LV92_9PLEO|nr:Cyclopentanone 12-monooxygenase [Pyrenophora seminiperda CCB06]